MSENTMLNDGAEAMKSGEASEAGTRTPPYISFRTWMTLMEDLYTHGLPPQIDRSVLSRFAGGTGSQIIMALKSLGLTDRKNVPNERFANLVNVFGEPEQKAFKAELRQILKDAYPFLADMDLTTATPAMFAEAFKVTGAKEDVLRKCRTFYLHAAQFSGVEIGPRLQQGKFTRASGSGPTRKRGVNKTRANKKPPPPEDRENPPPSKTTIATQLLEKFPEFDPSWPDEIKAKWFEGYERLLNMGDKK